MAGPSVYRVTGHHPQPLGLQVIASSAPDCSRCGAVSGRAGHQSRSGRACPDSGQLRGTVTCQWHVPVTVIIIGCHWQCSSTEVRAEP